MGDVRFFFSLHLVSLNPWFHKIVESLFVWFGLYSVLKMRFRVFRKCLGFHCLCGGIDPRPYNHANVYAITSYGSCELLFSSTMTLAWGGANICKAHSRCGAWLMHSLAWCFPCCLLFFGLLIVIRKMWSDAECIDVWFFVTSISWSIWGILKFLYLII